MKRLTAALLALLLLATSLVAVTEGTGGKFWLFEAITSMMEDEDTAAWLTGKISVITENESLTGEDILAADDAVLAADIAAAEDDDRAILLSEGLRASDADGELSALHASVTEMMLVNAMTDAVVENVALMSREEIVRLDACLADFEEAFSGLKKDRVKILTGISADCVRLLTEAEREEKETVLALLDLATADDVLAFAKFMNKLLQEQENLTEEDMEKFVSDMEKFFKACLSVSEEELSAICIKVEDGSSVSAALAAFFPLPAIPSEEEEEKEPYPELTALFSALDAAISELDSSEQAAAIALRNALFFDLIEISDEETFALEQALASMGAEKKAFFHNMIRGCAEILSAADDDELAAISNVFAILSGEDGRIFLDLMKKAVYRLQSADADSLSAMNADLNAFVKKVKTFDMAKFSKIMKIISGGEGIGNAWPWILRYFSFGAN